MIKERAYACLLTEHERVVVDLTSAEGVVVHCNADKVPLYLGTRKTVCSEPLRCQS